MAEHTLSTDSMQQNKTEKPGIMKPALAGSLAAYAAYHAYAAQGGSTWSEALFWISAVVAGASGIGIAGYSAGVWGQTRLYARALRGERIKGSAAFMSQKEATAAGLADWSGGAPLGLIGGLPVAAKTETHMLVNGPAGSGKSVSFFFPLLMHRDNACLVMDPKGEGFEVAGPVRTGRMGRNVVKLDPLDPASAQINPLDLIAAKLKGDNPEALTIARIYALQLHAEPASEGQNKFFRIGARRIITALMLIVAATCKPADATLARIYQLLINEDALNAALMAAASCSLLGGEIAAMAEELHRMAFGDSGAAKTYEQFRLGAMNSLEMFGPGSELARITATSTIRFADLKDPAQKLDVFVTSGPNHQETFAPWMGLMFRQAAYELVEVGNNTPVDFVMEEFTNAPVHELPRILTLLRSYGIRCTMIVQDIEDIARVYGKPALQTVLSESSVKVFLSVRSFETCELVSKMLGHVERVGRSFALGDDVQPSTSLESVPLLRPDEIRQLPGALALVIQQNLKPLIVEKVGYHEALPWAHEAGTNSLMGGGPYVGKPKLRLTYGKRITAKGRSSKPELPYKEPSTILPVLWFALMRSLIVPAAALSLAVVIAVDRFGLPHVLVGQKPLACEYVGPSPSFVVTTYGPGCPLIILKRSW